MSPTGSHCRRGAHSHDSAAGLPQSLGRDSVGGSGVADDAGVQIVGVEPKDSPILNGGDPGPHKIQGIGPNFIPEVLDRGVYDEIVDVAFDDSIRVDVYILQL